ncbi:hypothetical protein [Halomonas heilongjiangensis]|uniref:hypothetical protein n=1 Tax=Halomonas heilongjiangensis TaxID=1387883 RepID=UPI001473223E|nr:hypothetical protein [Halomonas heilongjiangensis]
MHQIQREVINPAGLPDTLRYGFSQAVIVKGGYRVHLSEPEWLIEIEAEAVLPELG